MRACQYPQVWVDKADHTVWYSSRNVAVHYASEVGVMSCLKQCRKLPLYVPSDRAAAQCCGTLVRTRVHGGHSWCVWNQSKLSCTLNLPLLAARVCSSPSICCPVASLLRHGQSYA
jgi:hypothetical protein